MYMYDIVCVQYLISAYGVHFLIIIIAVEL
jgi:hypothetical protein